jgi:peptidoglycan/xylan/chitin deacetylase (PgdA/CDA1 family)
MSALRRLGFVTVGGDEVLAARGDGRQLPARSVWVTFDDGYAELAEHAAPVLRANGQKATVFVATARVGGVPSWDDYAPDAPAPALLDWDGLAGLQSAGWDVGAHGTDHRDLTRLDDDDLARELTGPRDELAEHLGRPPRVLSYPFGAHDERVRSAVENAGYSLALTTDGGLSGGDSDMAMNRIYVFPTDSLMSFAVKVATGMDVPTLLRRGR